MANQLSGFVPDFTHMSVHLRVLTAKKNAFLWLQDHQDEFDVLIMERGGYPFNPFPSADFGGEAVTYHCRPAIPQPS